MWYLLFSFPSVYVTVQHLPNAAWRIYLFSFSLSSSFYSSLLFVYLIHSIRFIFDSIDALYSRTSWHFTFIFPLGQWKYLKNLSTLSYVHLTECSSTLSFFLYSHYNDAVCWDGENLSRLFQFVLRRLFEVISQLTIFLSLSSFSQIPNDFLGDSCNGPVVETSLYTEGLKPWLISIGLPMYYKHFADTGYDSISKLIELKESDFDALGVKDKRHQLILESSLSGYTAKSSASNTWTNLPPVIMNNSSCLCSFGKKMKTCYNFIIQMDCRMMYCTSNSSSSYIYNTF